MGWLASPLLPLLVIQLLTRALPGASEKGTSTITLSFEAYADIVTYGFQVRSEEGIVFVGRSSLRNHALPPLRRVALV